MDSRSTFLRYLNRCPMEGRRPKNLTGDRYPVCQTELGSLNTPGKQGKWQDPNYVGELGWKDVQEKLLRQIKVTVLKLTQVGGSRRLRRSGERWLRNSAKWPRKFAIRGASGGSRFWRPQKIGFCDCLSKTQDSANSQEDV